MKYIFIISMLCFCCRELIAQDSLKFRIILVGDAGEVNPVQQAIINDAVKRSVPGKTIALFLGDNIYRRGIGLETDAATKNTEEILRSQYTGLRSAGIPVYFIPGNHDWDHSGTLGYEKITRVNQFLLEQQDSLLQVIPKDACPGPYELHLSDNIVLVAVDSEWWLFPFDKHIETSECECKAKADVLGKLQDIIERNKNKLIFFATHHPFKTYGSHGGYYTIKQHIFPLTELSKGLYVPLPVVGSLYPLLRKTFPPAQDIKNIDYKDMRAGMEDILKQHPNVIHVAGHEHTLQLIQGAVLEVVSGAGCKSTPVRNGEGTLFAESESGYVTADVLIDNSIRLSFYSYHKEGMRVSYTYTKVYKAFTHDSASVNAALSGDSIRISLGKQYNEAGGFHRKLFGENYRDAWASEVNLPVLRLSEKGLVPTETGGGMQTRSLRLQDAEKKEWVLRSVDKYPDLLLPFTLKNTFAADVLKDNVTAAFPYAPLVVPVFATALDVAHSSPKLVYLAPDNNLKSFSRGFAKTVNLLEEREPAGKSVSTLKMIESLKEDNDNALDQQAFLRARLLDIFVGDWDRHGDQWRWLDTDKKKDKLYKPVPRDRDQVFYVNEGFFPSIFSLPWLQPKFQGFGSKISNINTFSFNARFIDGIFTNRLSLDDWNNITGDVVNKLSDTLIETALLKIPLPVYALYHERLSTQLKDRRLEMVKKVPQYFRFLNKVIDVTASDKNEFVKISDTAGNMLSVSLYKVTKNNEADKQVFYRLLDPGVTKELRLYLYGGTDSVVIDNSSAKIKLRIVGDGRSDKHYTLNGKAKYLRKIHVYDGEFRGRFAGEHTKAHLHLSNRQENLAFEPASRYNKTIPLLNLGYNVDDGLLIGAGVRFIAQGFRKDPFAAIHQVNLSHAFSTKSFSVRYSSQWLKAFGKADFLLMANILAPDNTQNFFGRGNETTFDKTGNYKQYYRTVFTIIQADPAIRWRSGLRNSITIGPSIQYYHFDPEANKGRFINNVSMINSYDSATIANDKGHAGLVINLLHDTRSSAILPVSGSYLNLNIKGYKGLNDYSESFGQVTTEIGLYKALDRKANFVLINRLGGGVTIGKSTFYQSLFLGGHGNLLGFRQYRFAGQHLLYNNLEARVKVANIASYIVPGQVGLVGFYHIGRVWENGYPSSAWHQGAGAGVYFAPAQLVLIKFVMGKSVEGWYPYFTIGFGF